MNGRYRRYFRAFMLTARPLFLGFALAHPANLTSLVVMVVLVGIYAWSNARNILAEDAEYDLVCDQLDVANDFIRAQREMEKAMREAARKHAKEHGVHLS